ncbi:hypothetical protein TeGR_g13033, partial [Tetraparma gracilis]
NHHSLTDANIESVAGKTDGYSGADLANLCKDAALGPIRDMGSAALTVETKDVKPISFKHFTRALRSVSKSVAEADLKAYVEWNDTFGGITKASEGDTDDDDSIDASLGGEPETQAKE